VPSMVLRGPLPLLREFYQRWLASSRQCFALDKWSSCRLIV
jgi:hypothetical protein